jgi:hypothetical protein
MRTRFASNILLGLAAGFVVVASQAFSATVTGWITFGVALGVLGLVGLTQLARGGGVARWVLDAVTAVLATWTVVASVVFDGTALTWLSFAEGVGLVVLAVAGLIAHEVSTERVVHHLEIEHTNRESAPEYARAA